LYIVALVRCYMDKLERYLASFDEEELKLFEKYLRSPFFEISPYVREFGSAYIKLLLTHSGKRISGKVWWEGIFPDQEFHDSRWRKLKSLLLDQVEAFWHQIAFQKRKSRFSIGNSVLGELNQRSLDKAFESEFRKLELEFKDIDIGAEGDFVELMKLWENGFNFYTVRQDHNKSYEPDEAYLVLRSRVVRRQYLFDCLKTATGKENRQYLRKRNPQFVLPQGFVAYLREELNGKDPLPKLYALLFQALENKGNPKLEPYLDYFFAHAGSLAKEECAQLFSCAINILVRQYLHEPKLVIARRLLELYQLGLRLELIATKERPIPRLHFKNICVIGCRLKQVTFAMEFLQKYSRCVAEDMLSQSTLIYCDALVLYEQKNFSACLKKLREGSPKGNLRQEFRSLEMKAQYDGGNYEILESYLLKEEKYLQRSKVAPDRREALQKRIRFMKKIHWLDDDIGKYEQLRKQILESQVHDSEWLLEKLDEKKPRT
jgi:hypothetical protein